jgi:hypothetical protein
MTKSDIYKWCKEQVEEIGFIDFPDELFEEITAELAEFISRKFASTTMMMLPNKEIRFFEWLKIHDIDIWNDLWDNPNEEPYKVGLSFLPLLTNKYGRGFPICDLVNNDNYYFCMALMPDKESTIMLESSKERFREKKDLTVAQLLTLEISTGPIDIWHFAYRHRINLQEAKDAVLQLVDDNVLVHFKEAEYLANFIEF